MMDNDSATEQAFVLGLDGVPWPLLSEWIADGHLPNFGRLYEEGAAGQLQSTVPATTAVAWPAIATGVNADKHGVYGFQRLRENYTHEMNTQRDIKRPRLWNILSPAVVGNVPMTYPASEMEGEMVTGMMTPQIGEGFTYPPDLRTEILEEIPDYSIGLTWSDYANRTDEFLDDMESLIENRRQLLEMLMERDWRFFFFVFAAPDRIQHLLWDEDVLLDQYRTMDDILGDVIDYVAEHDSNLFVVSDHGFGPTGKVVSLNRVLKDEGYLAEREGTSARGVLADIGITKDKILSTLGTVGIDRRTLVDHVPEAVLDRVAKEIPGDHVLYDVDYSETTAFVHGPGCLYINTTDRFEAGTVDPADTPQLKDELAEIFRNVTDPETGERALNVYDGSDLFPTDDSAPDLVIRGQEGYEKTTKLTADVFSTPDLPSASHRPEGVFLAWGPDVEAGARPENASVVDVAPTLLHSVGEPVPEDADGDVLDIFRPDSVPNSRAVRYRDYEGDSSEETGDEDFGDVEERLKGLGYME